MPPQKDPLVNLSYYKSNLLCYDHHHRKSHEMHYLYYRLEYGHHVLYRMFERKHILPHILATLYHDS